MVDLMDKDHMKICLTEMSTEVSNGLMKPSPRGSRLESILKLN